MSAVVPPLAFFCISALARFPDHLHHLHHRRIPASPALLDALPDTPDPYLWAATAQLVHPLPPHLHDRDIPLSHPALPLLQRIRHSPDFSLVTLVSLPNCVHLRDDDVASLRTLHRLLALDLRGCSISSYALAALSRSLAASLDDAPRTGPWGLRLLSLHGCPNIDNDVLSALHKFPLLSVLDLRFTRCTPAAVDACLSSLGFRPSSNNPLFYPASLALAICTLEKIAHTASDPVSLYSCPPQFIFRVHIDALDHSLSHASKIVPADRTSTRQTTIRTTSEDTIVFIPPFRRRAKNALAPQIKLSGSVNAVSALPTLPSIDQSTHLDRASNVSSFYENASAPNKRSSMNILPLSAQAVQSSKGGKLDPLAIARSPPPWNTLDTYNSPSPPNHHDKVTHSQDTSSNNVENPRQKRPVSSCQMGQALDKPLKVDLARLHKRGSDTVTDMVHRFASKRLKIESEFALAKARVVSAKPRNPFARDVRSVFSERSTKSSEEQSSLVHGISEGVPDMQLRFCHSLPSKLGVTKTSKPLKPITTLKPPILPKEFLPPSPRHTLKPRRCLKQSQLSFSREREADS